ncbi:MAG: hypothetical protein V2A72_00965 [Candidatus Omnitrophota bacterium]
MQLDVIVLTTDKFIFKGKAKSLILPGEEGVFEVLPFHKHILSRLITGVLFIDDKQLPIKRGVAQIYQNKATIVVEEPT